MIALPGFDSDAKNELLVWVNEKVREIVICEFQLLGEEVLSGDKIACVNTGALTERELEFREYCPASVPDDRNAINGWFERTVPELAKAVDDTENIYGLSLRAQYMLINIIRGYAVSSEDFLKDGIDDYEGCGLYAEPNEAVKHWIDASVAQTIEEEKRLPEKERYSDERIKKEITTGFTDIRCWIDSPTAPEYLGESLLVEDLDFDLLDKYTEEYLIESSMAYRFGMKL